jgi:hypothetical protein
MSHLSTKLFTQTKGEHMNTEELNEFALRCSLEHYLCNVDELLDNGFTVENIWEMVDVGNESIIPWEPYEFYEPSSLAGLIGDMQSTNLNNFRIVLGGTHNV